MYAVIFRAVLKNPDQAYQDAAVNLRERAITQYGCLGFSATTQGNEEIAVSYWETLEQIAAWKGDLKHLQAQRLGLSKWYQSCQVEVAEVIKRYACRMKP